MMVFHAPYPLDPDPAAASRLRPLRMRRAFEEIGYEVMDISGAVAQRRAGSASSQGTARIRATPRFPVLRELDSAQRPGDEPAHGRRTAVGLLDHAPGAQARRARRRLLPRRVLAHAGLRASGAYGVASNLLQRADLAGYRRNRVHFFLPSNAMSSLVGLAQSDSFSALPPGGDSGRVLPLPAQEDGLRLVYVGGLGGHYDLTVVAAALERVDGVALDLVVHQSQWRQARRRDPRLGQGAIRILHKSAGELEPVYGRAHIGVLAVAPPSTGTSRCRSSSTSTCPTAVR